MLACRPLRAASRAVGRSLCAACVATPAGRMLHTTSIPTAVSLPSPCAPLPVPAVGVSAVGVKTSLSRTISLLFRHARAVIGPVPPRGAVIGR